MYKPVKNQTEIKENAKNEKIKGNEFMQAKEYEKAIKHYTRSINLDENEPTTYANRALAYIKISDYDKGIEDCDKAIALKNDYAKAYFRRGICYKELNKFKEAFFDFLTILNSDPNNKDILNTIEELLNKWQDVNKSEYSSLFKAIHSDLKEAKNGELKNSYLFEKEFTKIQNIKDTDEFNYNENLDKKEKNEKIKENLEKKEENTTGE